MSDNSLINQRSAIYPISINVQLICFNHFKHQRGIIVLPRRTLVVQFCERHHQH